MGDPLLLKQPDAGAVLFRRLAHEVNGFPIDVAASAAINVLVKLIRQVEPTNERAQAKLDHLVHQAKDVLAQHYKLAPIAVRRDIDGNFTMVPGVLDQ